MSQTTRTTVVISFAIFLIAGAISFEWWQNQKYQYTPGIECAVSCRWPTDSKLFRPFNKPCLVVFVHEECPCTRATLTELMKVATKCRDRVSIEIVFIDYELKSHAIRADLLRTAKEIPSARILSARPNEARLFGATTSGYVALYNQGGSLVYHGGITDGRGHEGDNLGEDSLVSWITKGIGPVHEQPTYGCEL